jgi:hypothetical protein
MKQPTRNLRCHTGWDLSTSKQCCIPNEVVLRTGPMSHSTRRLFPISEINGSFIYVLCLHTQRTVILSPEPICSERGVGIIIGRNRGGIALSISDHMCQRMGGGGGIYWRKGFGESPFQTTREVFFEVFSPKGWEPLLNFDPVRPMGILSLARLLIKTRRELQTSS